jgi:HEAT repeat protein
MLLLAVAPLLLALQMPLPVVPHGPSAGGPSKLTEKGGQPEGKTGKVTPPPDIGPGAPVGVTPRPGSDPHAGPLGAPSGPGPGAGAPPLRPEVVYATGGADLAAITGGEEVEDWWIWWELNKSLYLISPADREAPISLPWRQQSTRPETAAQRRARLAIALRPLLNAALSDPAASVRAAAATALGRLGGDEACDALLRAAQDKSLEVRETAILALGATGTQRAASALLTLASDGHLPGVQGDISPSAGPLALVALGLGRLHGLDEQTDALVASLAQDGDAELQEAALLYDSLARTSSCAQLATTLAADSDLDIRLRCRLTEALLGLDPRQLPAVVAELSAGNPDRRRAAAVTLAGVPGGTILVELQDAVGKEKEPLARGLLLLSIGGHGGDAARELLQRQLVHGRQTDRAWLALGLGLLARAGDDEAARATLRQGLAEESSATARGAWLLALGLARDPLALPALRDALNEDVDPRNRMFAALSLAMLRDETALLALRAALPAERSDLARAGLLVGLAVHRRAEDAPRLLAELREAHNPLLQSQIASALGLNDTAPATDGLHALVLGSEHLPDAARAAALDALGLLLDDQPGLQLVRAATGRNFAVFPDWLARALVSTSL